jgi:hypothetical protein
MRFGTVGTLMRTGAKGTGTYIIAFTGRIGDRALRPGSYRAIIRATGAEGAHSGQRSTRFRIVNA